MNSPTTTAPRIDGWPHITADIANDGTGTVTIAGIDHPITADNPAAARARAVATIADTAAQLGRPLTAETHGPDGHWAITVTPDGTVTQATPTPTATPVAAAPEPAAARHADPAEPTGRAAEETAPSADPPAVSGSAATAAAAARGFASVAPETPSRTPAVEGATEQAAASRPAPRPSFLTRPAIVRPAAAGWRGAANRLGLHLAPSESERAVRADTLAVSKHWPGPRTIAVVNGKGGASKTPTTILISAVFARYGGAGVLAWDNNQTRGTLGWRTEQGPHQATLLDLLPHTDELLAPDARAADLARYVHHQTADRYDVLRSQPLALADQQRARVGAGDVDAIHAVAAKYYRLIVMDSGNDESDPMWLAMIDHADQIIIATTTRDDHAEAGALLLEALASRCPHCAQLVDSAVVVVSQADPKAPKADIQRILAGYRPLARAVTAIPYDPAMVDGPLAWDNLRPATRRAWLTATATIAHGL